MSESIQEEESLSSSREGPVTLDLVIPIYNEEEALAHLFRRLGEVFSKEACKSAGIGAIRYVFVDDGSTDRSAFILRDSIRDGLPGTLYRLSRNFGHQSAIAAGLHHSKARLVAVMDADLQDPPELLPEMVSKWREGFEVVYAQRRQRKEGLFKRASYWTFYRIAAFLSEFKIPLDSGDFCLMDRRVVDAMEELPENLRYPRVLRAWVGFRQTGIPYDRPARQAGRTKYTFSKLYRLATDGIVSSGIRLLRAAQLFSFCFAVLTVIMLIVFGVLLLRSSDDRELVFFFGVYFLICAGNFVVTACLYILGGYVGRTYLESKGRPAFIVMETIGSPSKDEK